MESTLLIDLFPGLSKEWDISKNIVELSSVSYGTALKAWWICQFGHSFQQKVNNRTAGNQGCPYCSGQKVLVGVTDLSTTHPELAREWSNQNSKNVTEVSKGSDYQAIWDVSSCGHTYKSRVSRRVAGHGCSVCSGHTVISGVNDLESNSPGLTNEWDRTKNILHPSEVLFRSSSRYHWICSKCSHQWSTSVRSRTVLGTGCPRCIDSNNPQVVTAIAKILGVDTINIRLDEVKWPTGQRLEVDILVGQDTVIEYDGDYWHTNKIDIDTRKTEILLAAGYRVIRLREPRVPLLEIEHKNLTQKQVKWSLDNHYWGLVLEEVL